jgi:hypothetical protein
MTTKISKNLSGPERWAIVDNTSKQKTKKVYAIKFGNHDFATWSDKQKQAYITSITGIKPTQGTNRDKKAGRSKGRYIKGKI